MTTDSTLDDKPVPVGTHVMYAYLAGTPAREYEIVEHRDPAEHPCPPPGIKLSDFYVDGVAYYLWPVGVERKFGNRHMSVGWVRRTSFRIADE